MSFVFVYVLKNQNNDEIYVEALHTPFILQYDIKSKM